jgi:hypothetical protein
VIPFLRYYVVYQYHREKEPEMVPYFYWRAWQAHYADLFYCCAGDLLAGGGWGNQKGGEHLATKEPGNRKRTGNKTSFKPGQSGNPNGRPKRTEAEKKVLEEIKNLAPSVPGVLNEILHDKDSSPAYRLRAAEIILDRACGKAEAYVAVDATVQPKGDFVLDIVGTGDDDAEDQA